MTETPVQALTYATMRATSLGVRARELCGATTPQVKAALDPDVPLPTDGNAATHRGRAIMRQVRQAGVELLDATAKARLAWFSPGTVDEVTADAVRVIAGEWGA